MNDGSTEAGCARVLYRCDPKTKLTTAYLLLLSEYDLLIADGVDPDTVSGAELWLSSDRCWMFDGERRLVQAVSKSSPTQTFIYSAGELVATE